MDCGLMRLFLRRGVGWAVGMVCTAAIVVVIMMIAMAVVVSAIWAMVLPAVLGAQPMLGGDFFHRFAGVQDNRNDDRVAVRLFIEIRFEGGTNAVFDIRKGRSFLHLILKSIGNDEFRFFDQSL